MKGASNVAKYGILCALALILSYLEAQVPAFFALPGMKLGITNIVVLAALYAIDTRGALVINIVRILLSALLFGSVISLLYSLAGGILSYIIMLVLYKLKKFHMVTVSIMGGVFHNIGQILVAIVLLQTKAVGWYLLILWFSGIATGAVIGILGSLIVKRIPDIRKV